MDNNQTQSTCSPIRKILRTATCYNPKKLKTIRQNKQLTRKEVINKTNLSYETIYNLETGRSHSPEFNTLFVLAELYDCCIGEFCIKPLSHTHCSTCEQKLLQIIRSQNIKIELIIKLLERTNNRQLINEAISTFISIDLSETTLKNIINIHKDIKQYQQGGL